MSSDKQNLTDKINEYVDMKIRETLMSMPKAKRNGNKVNCRCFICGDSTKDANIARGWFYLSNYPVSYFCFNENCTATGAELLSLMTGQEKGSIVADALRTDTKKLIKHTTPTPTTTEEPKTDFELELTDPNACSDVKKAILDRKLLFARNLPTGFKFYARPEFGSLVFPVIGGNDFYGYQERNLNKKASAKYVYHFNGSNTKDNMLFWSLDTLNNSYNKVFVIEGILDCIFVKNGISAGSIKISKEQSQHIQSLFWEKEIIWFMDNPFEDSAALKDLQGLAKTAPTQKVFCWTANDKKDINANIIAGIWTTDNLFNTDWLDSRITTAANLLLAVKFKR